MMFNPQRFYDRLGRRYDWFDGAEADAKAYARALVEQAPGRRLLNVGLGTGKEHARLQAIFDGTAFGLDISPVMVRLAHHRTAAPLSQADARQLPYAPGCFDAVYAAYVLDLLPSADLPGVLREFWRVLHPGGRLILLALTEGVDLPSRGLVAAWKTAYAISPWACGGCRPLQLTSTLQEAGFQWIQRRVIVQLGVPSEVILACKAA